MRTTTTRISTVCRMPPGLLEVDLVAVNVAGELALDLAVALVDDRLHRLVLAKHFGRETTYAVAAGDADEMAEQKRADATVLPLVMHNKGHFGQVRLRIEVIAADGDDGFAVRFGQGADDGGL